MAKFIDYKEISARIPFARATILNWAYGRKPAPVGFPPPVKIGGKLVWVDTDIDAWIESHARNSSLPPPPSAPQAKANISQEQPVRRGRGRPRKNPVAV